VVAIMSSGDEVVAPEQAPRLGQIRDINSCTCRALVERAGLRLSSPSVSALLTKQPNQLKLHTLAALCTALQCTPNDLIEVVTAPVNPAVARKPAREQPKEKRGRSMPPM
jgi:DNA-binding Xre family transcriptional regulator